jgi:hypothetical protein
LKTSSNRGTATINIYVFLKVGKNVKTQNEIIFELFQISQKSPTETKAPFTLAICKKLAIFLGLAFWLPSQKKAS